MYNFPLNIFVDNVWKFHIEIIINLNGQAKQFAARYIDSYIH